MALPDIIAALQEAVNPQNRRNRRRLSSKQAEKALSMVAKASEIVREVPAKVGDVVRYLLPPQDNKCQGSYRPPVRRRVRKADEGLPTSTKVAATKKVKLLDLTASEPVKVRH